MAKTSPEERARTLSRGREDHRLREEARSRQAFTIFSSCFGSSPYPSARIARTKSSSRGVANSPRITSSSSCFRFLALESCGRRPRLFSSAITSRMSSSLVPSAMCERRNDSGFLLTMQLTSANNPGLRLTGTNAGLYTVNSRWARQFRLACLESFRVHRIAERAACRNFRN